MAGCFKTPFSVGSETVRTQSLSSGIVCRMRPASSRWPLGGATDQQILGKVMGTLSSVTLDPNSVTLFFAIQMCSLAI